MSDNDPKVEAADLILHGIRVAAKLVDAAANSLMHSEETRTALRCVAKELCRVNVTLDSYREPGSGEAASEAQS